LAEAIIEDETVCGQGLASLLGSVPSFAGKLQEPTVVLL
jgi:hypothetical protein